MSRFFLYPFLRHFLLGNPLGSVLPILFFCAVACTPDKETPVEFDNIPPYSPIVSLSPLAPQTQDTITATLIFDPTDPDGDPVSLAYTWKKDGIEQTINGDTILHTQTQKGEIWTLEAYTFDGSLQSAPVSVSTTIRNTPPSITRVETTTDTPNAASHISIDNIEAEDADGDSISLEIHWYQDGAHRSEFRNDYIIPTEHIQKGQRWEASITPHDGEAEGEHNDAFAAGGGMPMQSPCWRRQRLRVGGARLGDGQLTIKTFEDCNR